MYTLLEKEIMEVPVPSPTRTYSPVSHESIIKTTLDSLNDHNLVVTNKQYQVAANGELLTGTYVIETPDSDFKRMISFINSYNKTRKLGFVTGLQTFVCQNGCISGDFSFSKKHMGTVGLEIVDAVVNQISNIDTEYENLKKWFKKAQLQPLDKRDMAELAGRMFIEQDILQANQLSVLKKEINKPSFDYGGLNNTAYDFYQHITHSLKGAHPLKASKQYVKSFDFINETCFI